MSEWVSEPLRSSSHVLVSSDQASERFLFYPSRVSRDLLTSTVVTRLMEKVLSASSTLREIGRDQGYVTEREGAKCKT